jgi:hypothetical protein
VIRLATSLVAYFLLAAAVAIGIIDGSKSVARDALVLTRFGEAPTVLLSTPPGAFAAVVKRHVPEFLWDPVCVLVLGLPAVLVLATSALVLLRLARRRPRKPGFATY